MREQNQITAPIMELLRTSLFIDPASPQTDLIEAGLIDSFGFMRLFVLLEEEFGIQIQLNDLDLDRFRTGERIAAFVIDKQRDEMNS